MFGWKVIRVSRAERLRREARLEHDTDMLTREVYRRALRDESTSMADVMGDVALMVRYGGSIITTDRVSASDVAATETYARTLLRRVVDKHPAMSGRIEI